MSTKLLPRISFALLISSFVLTLTFSPLSQSKADTTWVTTFNQNFQNWADVHYGTYVLPNTSTFQYSKILMYYTIGCPSAGCDPWDRLGWVKLYVDSTTNYEIARVITPYNIVGGGYPGQCVFVFDVTDYMSLLQDTVRLGSYIESWIGGTRGWLVTIKFAYVSGQPEIVPYKVVNLWQQSRIVYGDSANPVENYLPPRTVPVDPYTTKALMRVTNTGHGQGNTDNAAEFSFKIHTLTVGSISYDHVLWRGDCSANPCSPQGGTWQYARAGWCPGASVIPWDVDATSAVTPGQDVVIDYNLMPYTNFCSPNNPNCVTGVTCTDCNYNYTGHTEPHYTVNGQLILYKPNPFININQTSSEIPDSYKLSQNYPNPFNPSTRINFNLPAFSKVKLSVYDIQGKLIEVLVDGQLSAGSYEAVWNAGANPSGAYFYSIETGDWSSSNKMILMK
ncbi:MAG: T9SS type A sorting domain-containing protein [Ignavibacteria bacterium]|nr:T9SS type A sorting domain-containing protein [Ignavibacteria bacterium]